jgi:hypothetical protein
MRHAASTTAKTTVSFFGCDQAVTRQQVGRQGDQRHESPGNMHFASATAFPLLAGQQIEHFTEGKHLTSAYISDHSRKMRRCKPPIVVPAQGLTKADLMGNLATSLQLIDEQLALPFFPEDQRHLALVECLSGIAS